MGEAGPLYPKINSVWKRHPKTNRVLMGDYTQPEFEYLANAPWLWYEKIDGTNIRLHWDGNGFIHIGGRTDKAQLPVHLYARLLELIPTADVWAEMFDGPVTVYGEGFGAGIQKSGGTYSDQAEFSVFDVRIEDWWLKRDDVFDIATGLGFDSVPFLGQATLTRAVDLVKADQIESAWPNAHAEGLVGRPKVDLRTRRGDRIITKIKRVDYP